MPKKQTTRCPACSGFKMLTAAYCIDCMRDYQRKRREAQRKGLWQPTPKAEKKPVAAAPVKPRVDPVNGTKKHAKPRVNESYNQWANAPAKTAPKRQAHLQRTLPIGTSPELLALLDELIQLGFLGVTREEVAGAVLRQAGCKLADGWKAVLATVVPELG